MVLKVRYGVFVSGDATSSGAVRLARFSAFSDGVFAIAITLLVLELAIPAGSGDRLLRAVLDQWPSYLGYVVSFFTIGAVWIAHVAVNERLERASSWLLRLNLVLLFFVAFLPFPTRLIDEYVHEASGERVAVTFYGLVLLAMNVALTAEWRYAVAAHQVQGDADPESIRALTDKLTPSLGFYVVALAVGLLYPIAAVILYLIIAVYLFLPLRLFRRLRRRRR
jgi:TMEM175 potassium channel family protein